MSIFRVTNDRGTVLLETDDWVAAEARTLVANWPSKNDPLYVKGTHPTHEWDDQSPRRCRKCGGWDNGSYGSHAPCGYDFRGESLLAALERERSPRAGESNG